MIKRATTSTIGPAEAEPTDDVPTGFVAQEPAGSTRCAVRSWTALWRILLAPSPKPPDGESSDEPSQEWKGR